MESLTVGLVQQRCTPSREDNIAAGIAAIRRAAALGARLIVLPELHCSRYFCQEQAQHNFDLAESIPGPATHQFGALARELAIVLVLSLFERRAPGLYHNTAVVIDADGTIAGIYRKMHIPHDPGYCEKYYFTPGDLGFTPIATSLGRLGILVCWDQWYPEAARLMALAGAELLIYPTAIGWDPADNEEEKRRQLEAWVTIQRSHAVANGIPLISANRTGYEPDPTGLTGGIAFWGNSFIAGPQGELLALAGHDDETVLTAAVDGKGCETVRRAWPFLRDRRIDAYQDLHRRYTG